MDKVTRIPVVHFSKLKLIRGIGPTILFSSLLFFLLLGPYLYAVENGIANRISVAGPIALGMSLSVILYWFLQLGGAIKRKFYGVSIVGGSLEFFTWRFRRVEISHIASVDVINVTLQDRVSIRTVDGDRMVILSNLMKGSASKICGDITRALDGHMNRFGLD